MTRPAPFRQSDITRAVRGAKKAGMVVGRFEIDPTTGKIVVHSASGNQAAATENSWGDYTA